MHQKTLALKQKKNSPPHFYVHLRSTTRRPYSAKRSTNSLCARKKININTQYDATLGHETLNWSAMSTLHGVHDASPNALPRISHAVSASAPFLCIYIYSLLLACVASGWGIPTTTSRPPPPPQFGYPITVSTPRHPGQTTRRPVCWVCNSASLLRYTQSFQVLLSLVRYSYMVDI